MIAQLRAAGIAAKVEEQEYPNGRFARVYDPEGNPVELWEPGWARRSSAGTRVTAAQCSGGFCALVSFRSANGVQAFFSSC
jgi:hypothetical protein